MNTLKRFWVIFFTGIFIPILGFNASWAAAPAGVDRHGDLVLAPSLSSDVSAGIIIAASSSTPGNTIQYGLSINNLGEIASGSVRITNTLPLGTLYLRFGGPVSPLNTNNQLVWEIPTIAAASGINLSVDIQVPVTMPLGTNLESLIEVKSVDFDANTANNQAVISTTVVNGSSDLYVSKFLTGEIPLGNPVTYRITVSNYSSDAASEVIISDTLPSGLVYLSSSGAPAPTITGQQVVWRVPFIPGSVDPKRDLFIDLQAQVTKTLQIGSLITNTVQIYSANDVSSQNNTAAAVGSVQTASHEMGVYQTTMKLPVQGSKIIYCAVFENIGNSPMYNVVVTETLPAGVQLLGVVNSNNGCSPSGVFDPNSPVPHPALGSYTAPLPVYAGDDFIRWEIPALPGNSGAYIWITAQLPVSLPIGWHLPYRLEITSSTSENLGMYTLANKIDGMDNLGAPLYNLKTEIRPFSPIGDFQPGNTFEYVIDVTSNGNMPLNPVIFTDTLPADMSYAPNPSFADPVGWTRTISGNMVVFRGYLQQNEVQYFYLKAALSPTVARNKILENMVEGGIPNPETTYVDNKAILRLFVLGSGVDLSVEKHWFGGERTPNQTISYQIKYNNLGNAPASGVVITDSLPVGLSFAGWDTGDGANVWSVVITTQSVRFERNPLVDVLPGDRGELIVYALVGSVADGASLDNQVTIRGSETETNLGNNSYSFPLTFYSNPVDVSILKTMGAGQPAGNQPFDYTVQYFNNGASSAAGVTITDTLPDGLVYLSSTITPTRILQAGRKIVWDLGDIPGLSTQSFSIRVKLNPGVIPGTILCNRVEIAALSPETGLAANWNEYCLDAKAEIGDLSINASANSAIHGLPGGIAETHYGFFNLGNTDARNVGITVTLPAGSVLNGWYGELNYTDLRGVITPTQTGNQIVWRLDSIPSGAMGFLIPTLIIPENFKPGNFFTTTVEINRSLLDVAPLDNHAQTFLPVAAPSVGVVMSDNRVVVDIGLGQKVGITVTDSTGAHILGTYQGISGPYGIPMVSVGLQTLPQNWNVGYAPALKPGYLVSVGTDAGFYDQIKIGLISGTVSSLSDSTVGVIKAAWLSSNTPNGNLKVVCNKDWSLNVPQIVQAAADGSTPFNCVWNPATEWDILAGEYVMVTYYQPNGDWVSAPIFELSPDPSIFVDSSAYVFPGGGAVLQVTYGNKGKLPAANVSITALLPDSSVWLTDTSGLSRSVISSTIGWNVGELAPNEFHTFNLTVGMPAGAASGVVFTSTVVITSSSPDPFTDNNFGNTLFHLSNPDPVIKVFKGTHTWNPAPGKTFVYQIDVCNFGTTNSAALDLVDQLPTETTLIGWWTNETGWSEVSRSAQSLHLQHAAYSPLPWCRPVFVRVLLDPNTAVGTVFTNTASISSTYGIVSGNDLSASMLSAGLDNPNLAIYKDPMPSIQTPGGELRYSIRVVNNGNVPYTGTVFVEDWFPMGTSFLSAFEGAIEIKPVQVYTNHVVFTLQGLENGFERKFQLTLAVGAGVNPGALLENRVYVHPMPLETMLIDNKSVVQMEIYPHGPNLVVKKRGSWDVASGYINPASHFQIDIYNAGDLASQTYVMTDTYPAGFSVAGTPFFSGYLLNYASDVPTHRLIAQFSSLPAGDAFNIGMDLAYPAGNIQAGQGFINSVVFSNPVGEVVTRDNLSQFTLFTGPELNVEKFIYSGQKQPGGVLTFTIQVSNWQSPGTYWWNMKGDAIVTDTLPVGMSYLRAFTGDAAPMYAVLPISQNGQQIAFNLGQLHGGYQKRIWVVAKIADNLPTGTLLENSVVVRSSLPGQDLENNLANNNAKARFTAITPPTPPTAVTDIYTTTQGVTLRIFAPGLLKNDLNPDGSNLVAKLTTRPLHGSIMLNLDGSFAYAPDPEFLGTDTFTYQALNPAGSSAPAAVTINVQPQPQDLFGSDWAFRTSPATIFESSPVSLTMKVFRKGGSAVLVNVPVKFFLEGSVNTEIGETFASALPPYSSTVTPVVVWNSPQPGTYRLIAVIDPNNIILETDETNNTYSRTITVLRRPLVDTTPPVIDAFGIEGGAQFTQAAQVNLQVQASDTGGAGIRSVMFVQFVYSQTLSLWTPISYSPWMPYASGLVTFTQNLSMNPGIHYWRAWAADHAGNVSEPSELASINFNPASADLMIGQGAIYRVNLAKNDHVVLTLSSMSGDADLFVWGPGNSLVGESILETTPDIVDFVAAEPGVYQFDVVGYTDAVFSLTIAGAPADEVRGIIPSVPIPNPRPKARSVPLAAIGDDPVNEEVPLPPAITYQKYFFPIVAR